MPCTSLVQIGGNKAVSPLFYRLCPRTMSIIACNRMNSGSKQMLTGTKYIQNGIDADRQRGQPYLDRVRGLRYAFLVVLLISFLPFSSQAKNKELLFDAPPDKVYQAALQVAERYYSVISSDERNRTFQFYLRQFFDKDKPSGWVCSVWIEQEGPKSKVTMNLITRGVVGWGSNADKFLKRVTAALK